MQSQMIALVHEDQSTLDLMSSLLGEAGYRTTSCRESAATHEMLRATRPSLIVLNVATDRPAAGWQLLDLIRLDPVLTATPVVVCSADSEALQRREVQLRAKRCEALVKPFELGDLLDKIRLLAGAPEAQQPGASAL